MGIEILCERDSNMSDACSWSAACNYNSGGQGELTRWKTPGKSGYFTEKGVHFYPNVKREDIPKLPFSFG